MNKIPGGLADENDPGDFDQQELAKGMEVELEHTSDENIALEIAMDHLKEDPRYYSKLKDFEGSFDEAMVKKSAQSASGYPGSSTGGMRTMPSKVWIDKKDLKDKNGRDVSNLSSPDGDLESNIPDDVPDELKKTNITQPILKEPDDWLNPKVAKHRGPGA